MIGEAFALEMRRTRMIGIDVRAQHTGAAYGRSGSGSGSGKPLTHNSEGYGALASSNA